MAGDLEYDTTVLKKFAELDLPSRGAGEPASDTWFLSKLLNRAERLSRLRELHAPPATIDTAKVLLLQAVAVFLDREGEDESAIHST